VKVEFGTKIDRPDHCPEENGAGYVLTDTCRCRTFDGSLYGHLSGEKEGRRNGSE